MYTCTLSTHAHFMVTVRDSHEKILQNTWAGVLCIKHEYIKLYFVQKNPCTYFHVDIFVSKKKKNEK